MTAAVDLYQLDTGRLSEGTERAVLGVYAQWVTGELDYDTAAVVIAGIINRANAAATAVADSWLAVQIEQQARLPVPTVGIVPADDSDRLLRAATTVLDDRETGEMRLARLGRAEPLEAAHQATTEAIRHQPLVEGWTRAMDGDPCQLCRWWWRQGRTWPKAHPFQRHKGCNCQPRIVVAENIQSTGYTRQLERNRA
uniref:Phage head morphogenesis domain-containing protein n=2 Tax=unclassified Mycobacterium TaxID=2642494 RepID=A0A5Q5BLF3_MYCSS